MTAPGSAIATHGLTKSYGSRMAVDALDLEVEAGSVVGLLGPNGAGKTTLIRLLTTVLRADRGSFTVAGSPHTAPAEIRRRIGVLPEGAGHPGGQTGEEAVVFHARLFGLSRADARREARALLAQVGLADRAGSMVRGYSRGMRQRLGIARALVGRPAVLFLDEPTLGLDPVGRRDVLDLVASTARERGVSILLSTHLLAEVEEVCDRVVILHRGRVVADGSLREVATRAAAPRQCLLRVPPTCADVALAALRALGRVVSVEAGAQPGDVRFEPCHGVTVEAASAHVLRSLLDAEVPVLSFDVEAGRLRDSFLELTAPS